MDSDNRSAGQSEPLLTERQAAGKPSPEQIIAAERRAQEEKQSSKCKSVSDAGGS